MKNAVRRASLGVLCALALGLGAAPAQAAFDDPLYVYRPVLAPPPAPRIPPPAAEFEGPCGLAVDGAGNFYVSDYYHHTIDLFGPGLAYGGQIVGVEPLDGPCGLALDAAGNVYVNGYHRSVIRFGATPAFGAGTVIAGAPLDASRPTGVAVDLVSGDVYVNERDRVAVFDSAGVAKGKSAAPVSSRASVWRSPSSPRPKASSTSPTPATRPSRSTTRRPTSSTRWR